MLLHSRTRRRDRLGTLIAAAVFPKRIYESQSIPSDARGETVDRV
jgi:hypothetical protein